MPLCYFFHFVFSANWEILGNFVHLADKLFQRSISGNLLPNNYMHLPVRIIMLLLNWKIEMYNFCVSNYSDSVQTHVVTNSLKPASQNWKPALYRYPKLPFVLCIIQWNSATPIAQTLVVHWSDAKSGFSGQRSLTVPKMFPGLPITSEVHALNVCNW